MWSFAGHKRVDSFRFGPLHLSTGPTGENPDAAHFGWAGRANPQFPAKDPLQSTYQFGTIYSCRDRKPEVLPVVEKKRFWSTDVEGLRQKNVVSDFGMQVQRKMRTVNCEIGRDCSFDFAKLSPDQPMQSAPEYSVMHDEQIHPPVDRHFDDGFACVDGCSDLCHPSVVLKLEPV
jgi:hypothetical protein